MAELREAICDDCWANKGFDGLNAPNVIVALVPALFKGVASVSCVTVIVLPFIADTVVSVATVPALTAVIFCPTWIKYVTN